MTFVGFNKGAVASSILVHDNGGPPCSPLGVTVWLIISAALQLKGPKSSKGFCLRAFHKAAESNPHFFGSKGTNNEYCDYR